MKIKLNDLYLVGDNHLVLRVLPDIGTCRDLKFVESQGPKVQGSGFYCMPLPFLDIFTSIDNSSLENRIHPFRFFKYHSHQCAFICTNFS